MFLLIAAKCLIGGSVQFELPKRNMVIDPRPNNQRQKAEEYFGIFIKFNRFECVYHDNGTKVTLTRVDDEIFEHYEYDATVSLNRSVVEEMIGGREFIGPFQFRVYDPAMEEVPSFTSTTYKYLGVAGERPPPDTTVLIIDRWVQEIEMEAFAGCDKIVKCIMHDGVETIGFWAFLHCSAMKVIKLSRSLLHIEAQAFEGCVSLEGLFLPSAVEKIDTAAFLNCNNLRILTLPQNIDVSNIDSHAIEDCNTLFDLTHAQQYVYAEAEDGNGEEIMNSDEVHQAVIDFYSNLPPLHKTCLDTEIHVQAIHDCIDTYGVEQAFMIDHDGMMPLHILAMNPHADVGVVEACYLLNLNAALTIDNRGNTPLDYLRVHHDIEYHTSLMASLCVQREQGILYNNNA